MLVVRLTVHLIYPHRCPVWSRPRCNQTHFYDPKLDERRAIAIWARPYFDKPIEGPVKLEMLAYYKAARKKDIGEYKITRGDLDNCTKALCDALQGIAYNDDAQVCHLSCKKMFWSHDETHIWVSKL